MSVLFHDGAQIAFEATGTGPVLLATHGLLTTSAMWQAQAEELAREWTVVTWDLPGHGRTHVPLGGGYSLDFVKGCMAALLDHLCADRAVLLGFSLGGYLSLEFHHDRPERVAGLVLCSTGPGFRQRSARAAWNERLGVMADDLDQRGLVALHEPRMGEEVRGAVHSSAEGLAAAARSLACQRDSRIIDSLEIVNCPVLLVVGGRDHRFVRAGEYMHRRIPGSELAVIPSAGHAVSIHAPEEFTARVVRFLDERFTITAGGTIDSSA